MSSNRRSVPSPVHPPDQVDLLVYKDVVEQLPDAIILADGNGVIKLWNRAAEDIFGFPAIDVIGGSLDIIIPERFRKAHWDAFHQAVASGRTRHGNQVRTTRAIHKLGHKLYVDLSFGLVTGAAGSIVGSLAVARNAGPVQKSVGSPGDPNTESEGKTS